MRVFSLEFLIIFILSVLIIIWKLRSKKGHSSIPRKFVSIRGQQLVTEINQNTPLLCLLEEGKKFGEDFQEKENPELPHGDDCECELKEVNHSSADWFLDKNKQQKTEYTDLGILTNAEKRYYKFILISQHPNTPEGERGEYQQMAEQVFPISEAFRMEVKAHLKEELNSQTSER
ncbi:MAG: hypothetical protein HOD92_12435 [Deltaproteobacteria bacterium]|jgi:hypothetical protein|nr:hypothetical protein [Deltaproteobacteria bacterium]MBT4525353.1 hypothetical protein [Deltaproteobacteria bacterium]